MMIIMVVIQEFDDRKKQRDDQRAIFVVAFISQSRVSIIINNDEAVRVI
jgi:hypothetical protein